MIGLNLVEPHDDLNGIWSLLFPSVRVVVEAEGITKLVGDVLFNLLSTYDPLTGVGSFFRSLVAAPILFETNKELANLLIAEEIDALEKRLRNAQSLSPSPIPLEEQLVGIRLLGIEVDLPASSATIRANIINGLNQKAYVIV